MRSIISIAAVTLCFWSATHTGRAGLARLYSTHSQAAGSLQSANNAVHYASGDPEALYARALLHEQSEELTEALRDFERAVELRPHDYLLWLEFGRALQLADEQQRALSAFQQSVKLAPYSIDTRWQLGNLLLRAGRPDEAFAELRHAVEADPELLPIVFELAWNAYRGNTSDIEHAIAVDHPAARVALAQFLLKHGDATSAIQIFKSTKEISVDQQNQFVLNLIALERFADAFEVWSGENYKSGVARIVNGNFEESALTSGEGFGWKTSQGEGVQVALDANQARTGRQSAVIEFSGLSDPATALLTQLVLVEPQTSYELKFADNSQNLLTGGLPSVVVTDAAAGAESIAEYTLPLHANSWEEVKLTFRTRQSTSAIRITVQRHACTRQPCPALGRLWLDDFSLERLK